MIEHADLHIYCPDHLAVCPTETALFELILEVMLSLCLLLPHMLVDEPAGLRHKDKIDLPNVHERE